MVLPLAPGRAALRLYVARRVCRIPNELGFHTLAATALVLCSIASIVSSQFVAGVV